MATVSVLIPAFKAQYLRHAIGGALNQTFQDIEVLVGDDTRDGLLAEIVNSIKDPRLKYFHHGFGDAARNGHALWEKASGRYVKWLFDDDLLMPLSVETLVTALRANPDSLMAFHGRVFIDGNDNVTSIPPPVLQMGQAARVERAFLMLNMIGQLSNFIGEPSNILLDRERGIDASRMFDYRSWKLDFLGDVALYLNVSEQAPIVAAGGYLSAFRQHAGQASSQSSPRFSAGLYEWELMVRGEAASGQLNPLALAGAKQRLAHFYTNLGRNLPEIARLAANLDELTERSPSELLQSEQFQADLAYAREAVAARVAMRN
jgi:glycosyltransferase involved in cell wall biosynthesis